MTSGVLTRPPGIGGPGDRPGPAPGGGESPARRRSRLRAARLVAFLSILLAAVFAFHGRLPGGLGSAVGTALPWLGILVPVLLVIAVVRRARRSWMLVGLPLLAWLVIFGPMLVPLSATAPPVDSAAAITVASQNVEAASGTAAASGSALAAGGADIIALEELTASSRSEASAALAGSHPYSYTVGTVGLWSIYPLADVRALSLGLSWQRALTAQVQTPSGDVSVYVVHAASIRPGKQVDRDMMIAELARTIAADPSPRVLALGDFNAATEDPALRPMTAALDEPNQSKSSLGFTWPAAMPAARIDHIFERGLAATTNTVAPAGGSDHLAVIAHFNL